MGIHAIECNGKTAFQWKILDQCDNQSKLMTLEALFIRTQKPVINTHDEHRTRELTLKAEFGDKIPPWKIDTIWNENFNITVQQNQSKFTVINVGFFKQNVSICICYIKLKMNIHSDVNFGRYDCRYVKICFKFPWMSDFKFKNIRKKVLNLQSVFKSC